MKKLMLILNSRSEVGGVETILFDWFNNIDFGNIKVNVIVRRGDFLLKLKKYYPRVNIIEAPCIKERRV